MTGHKKVKHVGMLLIPHDTELLEKLL